MAPMAKKKTPAPAPVALTETDIRMIAALAGADVRTVRRWLAGEAIRGGALKDRLTAAKAKLASAGGTP